MEFHPSITNHKEDISEDIELIRASIEQITGTRETFKTQIVTRAYKAALEELKQQELTSEERQLFSRNLLSTATNSTINGRSLEVEIPGRYDHFSPIMRKSEMLYIYSHNRELAQKILDGAVGIHGSTSGSLLNTLDKGLIPLSTLREQQFLLPGGERNIYSPGIHEYTSFANWHEIGRLRNYYGDGRSISPERVKNEISYLESLRNDYLFESNSSNATDLIKNIQKNIDEKVDLLTFLENDQNSEDEQLQKNLIIENFPVVYGISLTDIAKDRILTIRSDIQGEFGIKGGLPVKNIAYILVPEKQIEFAYDIMSRQKREIKVFPLEDMKKE